ncbi:MAG: class IV adenylate cyclase [Candidatus Woesearchaeota archaeon]
MEIEIRSYIKNEELLRKQLELKGIKKISETSIEDIWYCKKSIQSYADTKMNKVGSYGLRIRLQDNKYPELTIKTIVNESDHQIFDESETEFKDVKSMQKILDILGFKVFCTVKKKRETYKNEKMCINIEKFENFPLCIEVEIIDSGEFQKNKDLIHSLMDDLGIDENDRIDTSITSLYMEKNSFFNNGVKNDSTN